MPLSDGRVASLLRTLSPKARTASVHILHIDGRIESAGMAIIELTARLPYIGRVANIAGRHRPTRRLTEAAYRVAARNRRHLARLVQDVEPTIRWRLDR